MAAVARFSSASRPTLYDIRHVELRIEFDVRTFHEPAKHRSDGATYARWNAIIRIALGTLRLIQVLVIPTCTAARTQGDSSWHEPNSSNPPMWSRMPSIY